MQEEDVSNELTNKQDLLELAVRFGCKFRHNTERIRGTVTVLLYKQSFRQLKTTLPDPSPSLRPTLVQAIAIVIL